MIVKTSIRTAVIECIDCGVKTVLRGQIYLGQELICPECGTWMQIVSLDPTEVDWIYEEANDDLEPKAR